jgi:hypothetical protein
MSVRGEEATTSYEILLRSGMGDKLAHEIGGRCFALRPDRTLLVVDVIDQAHLHGVLERLRDLNVDIERVNPV